MPIAIGVIIILAALSGINYYLSQSIYKGIVSILPKVRKGAVLAVFGGMTLLTVLGFARSFLPLPSGVKHILGVVFAYWLGIFVYLLLFTSIADIFTLICSLCKLSFIKKRLYKGISLAVVIVLTLTTVIYGFVNARQIDHVSYEIPLEGKADISDIKLVMISDLHLGAVGSESRLGSIVKEINGLEPDVICIAGDFFDTDYNSIRNPEKAIEAIKKLSATYGVYACLGNHDAGNTVSQMEAFLQSCNVQALKDEFVVIDNRLVLLGRLDASPIGGYGEVKRKKLADVFSHEGLSDLAVVAMDHNPANIKEYEDEVDLILSGHTHKGQLFPANIITDLLYEVDYGYYKKDSGGPQVVVTSGIGAWGMPMRVGTDSEIVTINFKTEIN